MNIISRADALQQGLKRYFTGVSCSFGHTSERIVSNHACTTCNGVYSRQSHNRNRENYLKLRKATYLRNREAHLRYGRKYQQTNAPKIAERMRLWGLQNRERQAEVHAAYRMENKDRVRAAAKAYRDNNSGKIIEYYEKNKHRYLHRNRLRQILKRQAIPSWADIKKIRSLYELSARLSKETGTRHHVDHIVPLRGKLVCGLHVQDNLQVIPAKVNLTKGNRFDERVEATCTWSMYTLDEIASGLPFV